MAKIFFHNDHDGKCAAYWVVEHYTEIKGFDMSRVECIEATYGFDPHLENIKPDEDVWIVDFSFESETFKKLLEITPNVVWIDHHKSSIEKFKDFNWIENTRAYANSVRCLTSEYAACVLTWAVCQSWEMLAGDISNKVVAYIKEHQEEIPWATRYVGDWDTWTHAYIESTQFLSGSSLYDLSPVSKFWAEINCGRNENLYQPHLLSEVLRAGKIINQYKENFNADYRKSFAYEVEFPIFTASGEPAAFYQCLVMNLGRCSSLAFGDAIKEYDICISTVYVKDHWQVSLYSDKRMNIDVSWIASQFVYNGVRGGGHPGAAGFSCEKLPWENA
jgi:hypothetical protein